MNCVPFVHKKRICSYNWKAQLYHQAREHYQSVVMKKQYKHILERYRQDNRCRTALQAQSITEENENNMGPNCRMRKKREHVATAAERVDWSSFVLPDSNDSRWSRHRGHHQAFRFAESKRMASRTCSSTRKQHLHTFTEFQLAVARLERLAMWKQFKLSIKHMLKEEVIFQVFRKEERDVAPGDREYFTV